MFQKLPLVDSLEHVASADELAEFRQLRRGGVFGAFGGSIVFGAPELTGLNKVLWLRAREHLIQGDWVADAFEGGNTVTPKSLHRDIWRFLEPNRGFTRVSGGGFDFVGVLVSGTINGYIKDGDQQPGANANDAAAFAADEDLEQDDAPSRTRVYGKIKALFERLDKELPLYECKPAFFARAREEIDPTLSEYLLLQVWGNAEVNSERRKPGVRKQIE